MMSVKFSPNALKQFFDVQEKDKRLFKALKRILRTLKETELPDLATPNH